MGDDRWRGGARPHDQNRQPAQKQSGSRAMNAQGGSRANAWDSSRDQSPAGPAQEPHVPVCGFNATEAKAALKKGDSKPVPYKPTGKDVNNKTGGPWGAKSNTMSNGKDFFVELRKQITALQQGGNVAGG